MGAKGSVEAAKINSDSWGQHMEVIFFYFPNVKMPFLKVKKKKKIKSILCMDVSEF